MKINIISRIFAFVIVLSLFVLVFIFSLVSLLEQCEDSKIIVYDLLDKSTEISNDQNNEDLMKEPFLFDDQGDGVKIIGDNKPQEQSQEKANVDIQVLKPVCDGILCNGVCWDYCPSGYDFVCESGKPAQCVAGDDIEPVLPVYFVPADSLEEKNINIETILLVRCNFRSQYFDISQTPWNEERISVGSGVLISSTGHILTAGHVVKVGEDWLDDLAGREWELENCKVAQTDKNQTPISATKYWGQEDDERFKDVEIFFETPEEDYKESSGLDFAILKMDTEEELPFYEIFSKIVNFSSSDLLIAVGYPSKISTVPQVLERFDGSFSQFAYLFGSGCEQIEGACGLRYESRRSSFEYQDKFWEETELGVITPLDRGGFSGGPVFYNGNLIGIVTHADLERDKSGVESGWETNYTLTSYDIAESFSAYNIDF